MYKHIIDMVKGMLRNKDRIQTGVSEQDRQAGLLVLTRRCHSLVATKREQALVLGPWLAVPVGESVATDEVQKYTATRFAVHEQYMFLTRWFARLLVFTTSRSISTYSYLDDGYPGNGLRKNTGFQMSQD